MKSIMVEAISVNREEEARAYALKAKLPYRDSASEPCDYLIVFEENHIEIQAFCLTKTKPFRLDFEAEKWRYRLKAASKQNELLAKAVGFKKGLRIVDATAGLGRDGFMLATLGANVTLLERSPILALLLKAALSPFANLPINERIKLVEVDAIQALSTYAQNQDVIYLDPMFPARMKSAAVKKEMLILRDLVGEDLDAEQLFAVAMACPVARIVVKRPIHAPILSATEAFSFSIKGKANRFDVYIRPSFSAIKSKS